MKTLLLAALPVLAIAAAPPPTAPTAVVHIKNFAFVPRTLTVAAGSTVRFVNDDGEAHTVTADAKTFDSGGLDSGDAWSYRFATPGSYPYFCAVHPYMRGTVVVTK